MLIKFATDLPNIFQGWENNSHPKFQNPKKSVASYLKLLQSSQASLFLTPTCTDEINKIVSALPSKASGGHDNLSNILLKEIIDPLAHILMEVFNKLMTVGEFPKYNEVSGSGATIQE